MNDPVKGAVWAEFSNFKVKLLLIFINYFIV